jgi:PBP1b-binding outer membrane lipoprotein LpoB
MVVKENLKMKKTMLIITVLILLSGCGGMGMNDGMSNGNSGMTPDMLANMMTTPEMQDAMIDVMSSSEMQEQMVELMKRQEMQEIMADMLKDPEIQTAMIKNMQTPELQETLRKILKEDVK